MSEMNPLKKGSDPLAGYRVFANNEARQRVRPLFQRAVEDQADLLFLLAHAEALGGQEHAEFQRHVEPRQSARGGHFGARDVVNAVFALGNDPEHLVDAHLARVIDFQSASRPDAANEACESDRLEKGYVLRVKRAVDEGARVVTTFYHRSWPVWPDGAEPQRLS